MLNVKSISTATQASHRQAKKYENKSQSQTSDKVFFEIQRRSRFHDKFKLSKVSTEKKAKAFSFKDGSHKKHD